MMEQICIAMQLGSVDSLWRCSLRPKYKIFLMVHNPKRKEKTW